MLFKTAANNSTSVSFETFLSGAPARDYVTQDTPYDEQIEQTVQMIKSAGYVLPGGDMSTAADAQYGGELFAGFYPFPDRESGRGFWPKPALTAGAGLDANQRKKRISDAAFETEEYEERRCA